MKHSASCFQEKIMSIYKTDLEINILLYNTNFDGLLNFQLFYMECLNYKMKFRKLNKQRKSRKLTPN